MNDNLIRDLTIDGFRAFGHFEMHDLGRVNLLVGKNNCGKSSVLEAIQIASSYGDPSALWSTMSRRGEQLWDENEPRSRQRMDVTHLFHGHDATVGNSFSICHDRCNSNEEIKVEIVEFDANKLQSRHLFSNEEADDEISPLAIRVKWNEKGNDRSEEFPLSSGRGISTRLMQNASYFRNAERPPIILVTTATLPPSQVVQLFDEIVLTNEEDRVLDALRSIEPTIERIAATSSRTRSNSSVRAGIVVKMAGVKERIPIGSMGDGIWRMLGLALALARSADGILLVDEIDTGLHHTVMKKMWKLVYEGAKRLNVQVFATTHSWDCVKSLAAIASPEEYEEGGGDDVTLQRIEHDKQTTVAFTGQEIVVAAERELEVR